MRPTLNNTQAQLLNAYWAARREAKEGRVCSKASLLCELETCNYESDIGLAVLIRIDDEYLSLYNERLKQMRSKK